MHCIAGGVYALHAAGIETQVNPFTENRDEYLPISQQQIDYSEGLYEQNVGW